VTERIRSDGVETIRATVKRSGGTHRPAISLPADRAEEFPESPIRVTIDGTEYHAPLVSGADGVALRGAYANPRRARERAGTDHLAAWIDDRGIDFGRSVLLDVVVPGEGYGLRAPGEDVVYTVRQGASTGLQDIARDLESS
jgi:hypothetical protein